jgi:hypothetical protein
MSIIGKFIPQELTRQQLKDCKSLTYINVDNLFIVLSFYCLCVEMCICQMRWKVLRNISI